MNNKEIMNKYEIKRKMIEIMLIKDIWKKNHKDDNNNMLNDVFYKENDLFNANRSQTNDEILSGILIFEGKGKLNRRKINCYDDDKRNNIDDDIYNAISLIYDRINDTDIAYSIIRVLLMFASFIKLYDELYSLNQRKDVRDDDLYHEPFQITSSKNFFDGTWLGNSNNFPFPKHISTNDEGQQNLFMLNRLDHSTLNINKKVIENNFDILGRIYLNENTDDSAPKQFVGFEDIKEKDIKKNYSEAKYNSDHSKSREVDTYQTNDLSKISYKDLFLFRKNQYITGCWENLDCVCLLLQGFPSKYFIIEEISNKFQFSPSMLPNDYIIDENSISFEIGTRIHKIEELLSISIKGNSLIHDQILEELTFYIYDYLCMYRKQIYKIRQESQTIFELLSRAVKWSNSSLQFIEEILNIRKMNSLEHILEQLFEEKFSDAFKRVSPPYLRALENSLTQRKDSCGFTIGNPVQFPFFLLKIGFTLERFNKCLEYLDLDLDLFDSERADTNAIISLAERNRFQDYKNESLYLYGTKNLNNCDISVDHDVLIHYNLWDYFMYEWGNRLLENMTFIENNSCIKILNHLAQNPPFLMWLKNWALVGDASYWNSKLYSICENRDFINLEVLIGELNQDISQKAPTGDRICSYIFESKSINDNILGKCHKRLLDIKGIVSLSNKWWEDNTYLWRGSRISLQGQNVQLLHSIKIFFFKLQEYILTSIHMFCWNSLQECLNYSTNPKELQMGIGKFIEGCLISTFSIINETDVIQNNLSECIDIMIELGSNLFQDHYGEGFTEKIKDFIESKNLFLEILLKSNEIYTNKLSNEMINLSELIFDFNSYFKNSLNL